MNEDDILNDARKSTSIFVVNWLNDLTLVANTSVRIECVF